ncbi:MAG: hypothetical protein O7C56_07865 [Rickettsia endosymbiont of Ixodes persulcatus]|nr:hypothetical protein [Rickettsia endosymbiont of Ixodes persulcatus]
MVIYKNDVVLYHGHKINHVVGKYVFIFGAVMNLTTGVYEYEYYEREKMRNYVPLLSDTDKLIFYHINNYRFYDISGKRIKKVQNKYMIGQNSTCRKFINKKIMHVKTPYYLLKGCIFISLDQIKQKLNLDNTAKVSITYISQSLNKIYYTLNDIPYIFNMNVFASDDNIMTNSITREKIIVLLLCINYNDNSCPYLPSEIIVKIMNHILW